MNQASANDQWVLFSITGKTWWSLGAKKNGDFWISDTRGIRDSARVAVQFNTGNVGIGTNDPGEKLEVVGNILLSGTGSRQITSVSGDLKLTGARTGGNGDVRVELNEGNRFVVRSGGDLLTVQQQTGNVGIGQKNPTEKLHVVGNVFVDGNIQATGTISQGSSRQLKEGITDLSLEDALVALQGLNPVTFSYKADERKARHAGFIAEDVPELVANPARRTVSPMDIIAMLTKVVQQQQQKINTMEKKINNLVKEAGSR